MDTNLKYMCILCRLEDCTISYMPDSVLSLLQKFYNVQLSSPAWNSNLNWSESNIRYSICINYFWERTSIYAVRWYFLNCFSLFGRKSFTINDHSVDHFFTLLLRCCSYVNQVHSKKLCIQGYFLRPSLFFRPSALAKGFAPSWIHPDRLKIYINTRFY